MRFDVNLSILFTEVPLLERPAAARAAGFDAVEMWWPFAVPVPGDREIDALLRALDNARVRLGEDPGRRRRANGSDCPSSSR